MAEKSNTALLKQMTRTRRQADPKAAKSEEKSSSAPKKSSFSTSSLTAYVPDYLKKPNTKQVIDVALFTASVYLIYNYGKDLAKKVEDMCPSEKSIMDMMQQ